MDSSKNILTNYNFNLDNYINKMQDNPYIDELNHSIKKQQIDKLRKYFPDDCINHLSIDALMKINSSFTDSKLLLKFFNELNFNNSLSSNEKLSKINQKIKTLDNTVKKIKIKPTQLRISTMTMCGDLGNIINTSNLYKNFVAPKNCLSEPENKQSTNKYKKNYIGIIGCKADDLEPKGYFNKKKLANFFNSATLNILISDNKCINFKLFKNGKIQLTGVPSEELGLKSIDIVIDYIKQNNKSIVNDIEKLKLQTYKIVLINSDYDCGFMIHRDNLANILINKFNLSVNFDCENYPGVKLQYFYNTETNSNGICNCLKKCIGKGDGNSINNCKKITISTFQSGKIIITGGRTIEHINTAYNYFNQILENYYNEIVKSDTDDTKLIKNYKRQHFYIKKQNISNFDLYSSLINI
uniref:Uncharacterized protein n=1 Tax=viral metagenome TaxID=1070528 RepID=A0A6C0IXP0_9ZZZZ